MESRFCLKQLTESEVDSIMAFQKEIIEGLTDKTMLRKNTRQMFQQCVRKPNYTLGVYEGEVLAALGILFDGSGTEGVPVNKNERQKQKGVHYEK